LPVTLVLGGARSGKSAFAQAEAERIAAAPILIATAEALDGEMADRIAAHRTARGPAWRTIEAPQALREAIVDQSADSVIVVDCLTLWLNNLMMRDLSVEDEMRHLVDGLAGIQSHLILVANEVGFGIVPENRLARNFRDHAGRLNQMIAAKADRVVLVVAGIAMEIKSPRSSGPSS
jgi:adenosylcobinamide kinase/adenosylcobinamide-phosphate guanylyltransferase